MGHAQHRVLLRGAGHAGAPGEVGLTPELHGPGEPGRGPDRGTRARALGLDGVVVPSLLLLIARDLFLHDPPRVLAWRILHDPRLASVPEGLAFLLPRPPAELDRDPVALLLGSVAAALAVTYLGAALAGARARVRGAVIALACASLVVLPSAAFVAMGVATGRPYGQDGGVVQIPLALDKILAGQSPYGADYSDSILGKEARVSDFWASYGGNPILRHHAYLPGTHLLMMPAYLLARSLLGFFDPRGVTLTAYLLAAFFAVRLFDDPSRRLTAAALVTVNPLVYWHQIFGANDVIVAALILLAVLLAARGRPLLASAALGLACATKQLAWPFAPFLLIQLSGIRSFRDLWGRDGLARLARPSLVAAAVFLLVVAPVAALDPRAFWGDIVVYNVGLPGGDNYPLGGTPGFGFANFLIYCGAVSSLRDHFPFGVFYLLLVPLGLVLLLRQMREGTASTALVSGSIALLASLYFSRVVHPNYLVLAAVLLPVAFLMDRRLPADVAVVPLLLLALAVEVSDQALLRTTWEQAISVRLPQNLSGLAGTLAPRAGPPLTLDPLGLAVAATMAGIGVFYLGAGILGTSARVRLAAVLAAVILGVVLPTLVVVRVGQAAGEPRAQAGWMSDIVSWADRWGGGTPGMDPSRRPPLQAWSESFRRDPPTVLSPTSTSPGSPALGWILAKAGLWDPRPLTLLALVGSAALLCRLAPAGQRALAVGASLLSPAAAVGVIFGSSDALLLAAVLGAWALARHDRPFAAAVTMGLAMALFPRAFFVAPFVLLGAAGSRAGRWRATLGGVALGYTIAVAPLLAHDPRALGETLLASAVEPGLGLASVLSYWGIETTGLRPWSVLPMVLPLIVGFAALRLGLGGGPKEASVPAVAAAFLLLGSFVSRGSSPHDLAVPMALLLLSALASGEPSGVDSRPAAA